MKLISRLFVFEWYKSLAGALIALLLLVTTADIINGFLMGKDGERVLLEWALKMPDLMGKMLPITCLLATLFSINRLKSHNELIAALAAGFSFSRIISLVFISSLIMVILQFVNLGYLEPYANGVKRREIERSKVSEGKFLTRSAVDGGQFWYKSLNYFATFSSFDKFQKSLNDLDIYFFDQTGLLSQHIRAKRALYKNGTDWTLLDAKKVSNLSGDLFPSYTEFKELTVSLNETPSDFGEFESDLTTLNWFNLKRFIDKISHTGINTREYLLMLHQKVALSFSCLVFALIPLASLYRPNRRSDSFGKSVALALVLTVIFWVLFSGSLGFGQSGKLPAWLYAYFVPAAFFLHSCWTFFRNRKLAF